MTNPVTATVATIFLVPSNVKIDTKEDLTNHYDYLYQDARPEEPKITDQWFFIHEEDKEFDDKIIKDLTKVHDLRAVNFILLEADDPLSTETKAYFKTMLKGFENHFKINSYTGSLVLGVVVQCYNAMLFDKYRVHGLNRLVLGL